jgi:hypothetical protein
MLVARVCFGYFRDFEGMLQVFHIDVAKLDLDVADVVFECCGCCF